MIQESFPTIIVSFEIDGELDAMKQDLAERLQDGEMTQTSPDLHQHETWKPLCAKIMTAAQEYLDKLAIENKVEITGMWGNALQPTAHHRWHTHPNQFLSGAFFLQASDEGGQELVLHDPRPAALQVKPRIKKHNPYNANQIYIKPRPGTGTLFPSWLSHHVEANLSLHTRLSISFNLKLLGEMGYEEEYT